jgi:hypothetical protein
LPLIDDWSLIRRYVKWGTPQIAEGYDYLRCNNTRTPGRTQPAWGTDEASLVHGSDGLQFPPGVNKVIKCDSCSIVIVVETLLCYFCESITIGLDINPMVGCDVSNRSICQL